MMNFVGSFSTPSRQVPKWIPRAVLAISALGFLDALYLTVEHYLGVIPPCSVSGCGTVLTSGYAVVLGAPVALLGSFYYLGVVFLSIAFLTSNKIVFFRGAMILPLFGLLFHGWLVFAQAFLLHSFCVYCVSSALATLALAGFSLFLFQKRMI